MLLPLVMSTLASVKPTAEAAASPPTYFPHSISLDSYERLWTYQQGLPTYLANSLGAALLTIVFTLLLTVPAAYSPEPFGLMEIAYRRRQATRSPAGPDTRTRPALERPLHRVRNRHRMICPLSHSGASSQWVISALLRAPGAAAQASLSQ